MIELMKITFVLKYKSGSYDYLTIDDDQGGVDLVFPHHENEIAQSEAHSGH